MFFLKQLVSLLVGDSLRRVSAVSFGGISCGGIEMVGVEIGGNLATTFGEEAGIGSISTGGEVGGVGTGDSSSLSMSDE